MIDGFFFPCSNGGKSLAQASRRPPPDAGIAGDREGFQHDLLDNQAANKVTFYDAAKEGLPELLPMPGFDVIGGVHSDLAALGSEPGSVAPFNRCMLQCVGYFLGIVTYLRQRGVIHRGEQFSRNRLCQDVLPNRSAR